MPITRRRPTAVAMACAVAAATAAVPAAQPPDAAAAVTRAASVVRVVDGERVVLRVAGAAPRAFRLLGIDAPAPGDCFGASARARLRALLPSGAAVRVVLRSRGTRSVVVLRRGAGVNRLVVESGHALATEPRRSQLGRTLAAAQARAQGAGRGLWGACRDGADDTPAGDGGATPAPAAGTSPPPPPAAAGRSAAAWQAFLERSVLTQVSNSSSFGGSSRRSDLTFCPGGAWGLKSESFENGFVSSVEEGGRWSVLRAGRDAAAQADTATIELVVEQSTSSGFDPAAPEAQRTAELAIVAFDDGRLRVNGEVTQRSATSACG
ncbi:MAG TPA: thermonuclease family protein [Baekduia sp.]|nr:thermonuclease family protein [Baekduia sp.]